MKVEEEARLVEDVWQEAKEHDHAQLKAEKYSASPLKRDGGQRRRI